MEGGWGWVVAGYGLFYGAIVGYAVTLARRVRRARGRLEGRS